MSDGHGARECDADKLNFKGFCGSGGGCSGARAVCRCYCVILNENGAREGPRNLYDLEMFVRPILPTEFSRSCRVGGLVSSQRIDHAPVRDVQCHVQGQHALYRDRAHHIDSRHRGSTHTQKSRLRASR